MIQCWLKRRKREGIAFHVSSWRSKDENRLILIMRLCIFFQILKTMLVMYYAHIGRVMSLYFLQSLYGHLLDDASINRQCKCIWNGAIIITLNVMKHYYLYEIEFLLFIWIWIYLRMICVIPYSNDRNLYLVLYTCFIFYSVCSKNWGRIHTISIGEMNKSILLKYNNNRMV